MDIGRTIKKLTKLASLAKGQDGTPEGSAAAAVLADRIASSGLCIDAADLEWGTSALTRPVDMPSTVLDVIALASAHMTGCDLSGNGIKVAGPLVARRECERISHAAAEACRRASALAAAGVLRGKFGPQVFKAIQSRARAEAHAATSPDLSQDEASWLRHFDEAPSASEGVAVAAFAEGTSPEIVWGGLEYDRME